MHADDFGLNPAVTAGIVHGFERGLLTSTALLANAPDAADAVHAWKRLIARGAAGELGSSEPRRALGDRGLPFDLGIHLNLTQGRPLTGPRFPEELLDHQGQFLDIFRLYARLRRRPGAFRSAVQAELVAQVWFLLDRGLQPTHLNGHQYVELLPAIADLIPGLLARFRIGTVRVALEPALFQSTLLRGHRPGSWLMALAKRHFARRFGARFSQTQCTTVHPGCYFGTAHAGRINARLLKLFLSRAPRGAMVEICMHPAMIADSRNDHQDGWLDPLARLRPKELALLESKELSELLRVRQVELGRLSQLKAA